MGTISGPRAIYGLFGTGTPTKTQSSGNVQIGIGSNSLPLTGATKAYCVSATLANTGNTLTIDTETGIGTPGTAPVSQVETATAAGTIGTSGNAAVVVTGARITGSPITLAVAVVSGDTASVWAGKVRTALNANAAISSKYTVGGTTTSISLTEIIAENNDSTLNISLANGTCTGITAAPTSDNTTTGIGGVKLTNNTGDGNDFEGVPLGTMTGVFGMCIKNTGSGILQIDVDGTDYVAFLAAGSVATLSDPNATSDLIGDMTITADGVCSVEVTIIAQ
jgi:hypothetical protein